MRCLFTWSQMGFKSTYANRIAHVHKQRKSHDVKIYYIRDPIRETRSPDELGPFLSHE